MSLKLDNLRLAIKRLPTTAKDAAFALACKLLLPLSTMCKVCNMLRGMAIGFGIGVATTVAVVLLLKIGGA